MSEKTNDFASGAVRSADANHLDFASMPIIGLIGVARTAAEGGTKYGRHNYMMGMPAHDLLNHALRHQYMFLAGDRSEPHLEHAAWGLLAAIQSLALDPELSAPHLLGPGATVGEAMREHLDGQKEELKRRREAGEFGGIGKWALADLGEIKTLLRQRKGARWCKLVNETIRDYMPCGGSGVPSRPPSRPTTSGDSGQHLITG